MRSNTWSPLFIAALFAALIGCSDKKKSSGGGGAAVAPVEDETEKTSSVDPDSVVWSPVEGQGCLQGVITDGFTGERIDMTQFADPSGAFVLIRNQKLKARYIKDDPNLKGEYNICGIPVEQTYPVFVYIPGYLPFESTVNITSTRAVRVDTNATSNSVATEVKIPDPISMTNIRLYPLANGATPLRIRATYQGNGVAGATVTIEPEAATGHYAFEGTFANSAGTRVAPQRVVTDASGYAEFKAETVSLGHRYKYWILPTAASHLTPVGPVTFNFGTVAAAGGDGTDDTNAFDINVAMTDLDKALVAVSCSLQDADYKSDGSVTITFNRPLAAIDPDSWDAAISVAGNASGADFPATVADNNKAEKIVVSTSDRTMTLSPVWGNNKPKPIDLAKDPSDLANQDRNITVTYNTANIKVAVAGLESQNNVALSTVLGTAPGCAASMAMRLYKAMD